MAFESNKGLHSTIPLKNGKFVLTSGEEKVGNNVTMILAFVNWHRVYSEEFCADMAWLEQAPISKVVQLRKYISFTFQNIIAKYAPFITHVATLPTYAPNMDRKRLNITILFLPNISETSQEDVQFKTLEL